MPKSSPEDLAKLLSDLRKTYIQELPDKFDSLENHLLSLKTPEYYQDSFENAYRIAHSLKGSAGTYDFHILTHICHQLEDRLTALSSSGMDPASSKINLLEYVDLMREALELARVEQTDFLHIEDKLSEIAQRNSIEKFTGMIIDTSDTSIQITKNIFEAYPITFVVEKDGQTALQRLLHEPFDLLITSAELPTLSGVALIAALRLSKSRAHNLPIILVTSKITGGNKRNIDPNFIIQKDKDLIENMNKVAAYSIDLLTKK